MKKTTITFLATCIFMISGLMAQSVQDGIKHLNAGRANSAMEVI